MSLMLAMKAHAVELLMDFSQSFASRRQRPSHANALLNLRRGKKPWEKCVWMVENRADWASGHGQLTKFRLSDGCGGKRITTRRNLGMIAMNLKVIQEMSANLVCAQASRLSEVQKAVFLGNL